MTPGEAARHAGIAWHTAHDAFVLAADVILDAPPAPVAHLGIDEHRRGRPRWYRDEETGEYVLVADRWHTCLPDLPGGQKMIGQVLGRTADDAAYWLALAPAAWQEAVEVVCMDMCTTYLSAARRMLPGAQVAVDLFHVVHLASATSRPGEIRPPGPLRRPRVRRQEPADPQHRGPERGPARQDRRDPGRRRARAAGRDRLDRQGEAPVRPEPARPRHRLCPVRAGHPRPAARLL